MTTSPVQHTPPTPRELEVLELVSTGLSNGDIADRLVLSSRTVQSHVRALLEKTGCANRTDLAVTAICNGWVVCPVCESYAHPKRQAAVGAPRARLPRRDG